MALEFTIPLNPVTKKNSPDVAYTGKRCPLCHRGERTVPRPSKPYRDYEAAALRYIPHDRADNIVAPVNVKALFYRDSRRRCDLTNLLEALDDLLVTSRLIADDNCCIIVSHDGSRVYYDKDNPRTEITIAPCKEGAPWEA